MKKLLSVAAMLASGVLLAGCYSKGCEQPAPPPAPMYKGEEMPMNAEATPAVHERAVHHRKHHKHHHHKKHHKHKKAMMMEKNETNKASEPAAAPAGSESNTMEQKTQ